MRHVRPLVLFSVAALMSGGALAVACGGDDSTTGSPDGGHDATSDHELPDCECVPDAGTRDAPPLVDAAPDVRSDATPADGAADAPHDAGLDAPVDAALDAPVDAALDAPADVVSDAASDAPQDAPSDAADAARPQHAVVVPVHASADFPSMRLCFATAAPGGTLTVAPLPALPHEARPGQSMPGLDPGTGGPLPDLVDLSAVDIAVFLVEASKIASETGDAGANEKTCEQLLGNDGNGGTLVLGQDYWQMPTFPAGAFPHDSEEIVAFIGCLPQAVDPNASAARCGADYDANGGNLQALRVSVDRTAMSAGEMGAQTLHASSPLAGGASPGNHLSMSISTAGGTLLLPGVDDAYETLTFATFAPAAITDLANVVAITAQGGQVVKLTMGQVAQATTGGSTGPDGGPYFTTDETYTFVVVGDPNAQSPALGVHALAFANHLKPPVFQ